MYISRFQNKLEAKRLQITTLLGNVFWVVSVVVVGLNIFQNLVQPQTGADITKFSSFVSALLIFAILSILRFYIIPRNFRLAMGILSLMITAIVVFLAGIAGNGAPAIYLLIAINLLSASIVTGLNYGMVLTVINAAALFLVAFIHNNRLIPQNVYTTESTYSSTLVFVFLIATLYLLTRIGYGEIENSYGEAFSYAKELERLNENLEAEVERKTERLKQSYEHQAESVHAAAVAGRIAKAMVHDLATPVSALKGAVGFIDEAKDKKEREEVLELAQASLGQIERILQNSRSLLSQKNPVEEFHPLELINRVVEVVQHELHKHDIEVELRVGPDLKMRGVAAVLERIFINLVINAIDELAQLPAGKERKIQIVGADNVADTVIFRVTDTGRGIPQEVLKEVFDPDFSTKTDSQHLGFGLTFVRDSVSKFFHGKVSATSESGKYTTFHLILEKDYAPPAE